MYIYAAILGSKQKKNKKKIPCNFMSTAPDCKPQNKIKYCSKITNSQRLIIQY